jgi:hypothetical protein
MGPKVRQGPSRDAELASNNSRQWKTGCLSVDFLHRPPRPRGKEFSFPAPCVLHIRVESGATWRMGEYARARTAEYVCLE